MKELKVYVPQDGPYGLEPEEGGEPVEEETCYLKSDVDAVIAELKENHKKLVERLLMKIAGLEKLVETADKLLKPKGGFTIEDVKFGGIKLEGTKETDK